jgi:hypothetical protein
MYFGAPIVRYWEPTTPVAARFLWVADAIDFEQFPPRMDRLGEGHEIQAAKGINKPTLTDYLHKPSAVAFNVRIGLDLIGLLSPSW